MQKMTFSIDIQAPKLRIWETLWSEQTYPQWAKAFCEGSYVVTDWQEGSKVHFLAPFGDGMYSVIDKKIENEHISFRHLGNIQNKEEQPLEASWEGNYENYSLSEIEGGTRLVAEINSSKEFLEFFSGTFPQALQNIKELAEQKNKIQVETEINAPLAKVWACWTEPQHIQNWCFASEDWCAPRATNDLRVGGKFLTRMEARDGNMGFDFEGVYTALTELEYIEYQLADDRKVCISFSEENGKSKVIEIFDAENTHSLEMQKMGWQMILDNFRRYAETHN